MKSLKYEYMQCSYVRPDWVRWLTKQQVTSIQKENESSVLQNPWRIRYFRHVSVGSDPFLHAHDAF